MILDHSAVVAMMREERGYADLVDALDAAETLGIGAPTLVEAEIVLLARLGLPARVHLDSFLRVNNVTILPFGEEHRREAAGAFVRFGKGRHPAALNLGDCMTYATARIAGEPLLALGDDFGRTDLELHLTNDRHHK